MKRTAGLGGKGRMVLATRFGASFYLAGLQEVYPDCLLYEKQHLSRMVKSVDSRRLAVDDVIGQNALFYCQLLLRRSHSLLLGAVQSVGHLNSLSAVLNVRAHYEVTGAIGYLASNLDRYYRTEIQKADIEAVLARLILGRRKEELKQPYESVNVLSMIDTADRLFNTMAGKKVGMLRENYEWLSEMCHPNSYGLIMTTRKRQDRVTEFKVNRERMRINHQHLGYLRISIPLFFHYYDYVRSRIQEKEHLPELTLGFEFRRSANMRV